MSRTKKIVAKQRNAIAKSATRACVKPKAAKRRLLIIGQMNAQPASGILTLGVCDARTHKFEEIELWLDSPEDAEELQNLLAECISAWGLDLESQSTGDDLE